MNMPSMSFRWPAVAAVLAVACFVIIGALISAMARDESSSYILTVDNDALFRDSVVAQDIRGQLLTFSNAIKDEAKIAQDALNEEAKQLSNQKDSLDEKTLRQRITALTKRQKEVQEKAQTKSMALELGSERARQQMQRVLEPIFTELLNARDADFLVDVKFTLASSAQNDITAEVMKELNEALTKLKVEPISPEELKKLQQQQSGQ